MDGNGELRQTPPDDRQIRVFISSTFRDMQEERELLVKQVFPELRRLCAKRFVTFTEVDLRWGITEEQAAEGKVLPICLEEIRRCQPYFIGLLGERYGWIPDSVAQEVMDREPWLEEHVGGHTSVTELEILHGVLNTPEMADHAFFYFRDPEYLSSVSELDRSHFTTENAESAKKLKDLKERIRQSGLPVLENYANPTALAVAVRDQFLELIDRLYPKEKAPDPLDQEAMGHEAYGRGKLLAYVERPAHTAALDSFIAVESTGQGLVVTGESGGGKTALLASWVKHWRENHPEDFVFAHCFGATPESSSAGSFLRRLLGEIKRRCGMTEEVPVEPDKMRDALPLWLAETAGKGRVVLVLDGLNQVEGNEPDRRLAFLPRHFPPNVRVIASALPGPGLDALEERGWSAHALPLPDEAERSAMAEAFFGHFRKTFGEDLRVQVSSAPGSANPLFLRTVLEELRQFGGFEKLPARVAHYLEAESPQELFRLVLRRWQEDFDAGRDLVRRTLRLLWAARQGLSETEWLELLGAGEQPLPRQVWTPLFFAMEPHLAHRSGLYAFGHDFLREAVRAEFLTSDGDSRTAHVDLVDYFQNQREMTVRKAAEWPWQLHAAESWGRLEAALTDLDLFIALCDVSTQWELSGYWLPLRQQGCDMEACYARAYERRATTAPGSSQDAHLAYALATFLIANGCFRTGKALTESAAAASKAPYGSLGEFDVNYATCQNNLALLLEAQGDFTRAAATRERVLSLYELSFGKQDHFTATACINLAGTYLHMRRWLEAELLSRRALAIDENIYSGEHREVANDLVTFAESLRAGGKVRQAEAALARALSIGRVNLPQKHPLLATILSNLAAVLAQTDRSKEAEPLALEAVEIERECLGNKHPNLSIRLNNLAGIMRANGRIREALSPAQEALEILVSHSVGTGIPHHQTKAAAVALASLATEAGLAQQLVLHFVNSILSPMRNIRQARQVEEAASAVDPAFKSHSGEERPSEKTSSATDNTLRNDTQGSTVPGEGSNMNQNEDVQSPENESSPIDEAQPREGGPGIGPISQILVQLDPRNIRCRAEHGDPNAQCQLAMMLQSDGDIGQAVVWYRRAAEQGVAQAQFNFGVFLQNGVGVERNFPEAVRWYEKAAKKGYLNAIYNLAFMRENGYGCRRDLGAALRLYENAANLKEPDSQCKLALLLLDEDMQTCAGYLYRREGWDNVPEDHERAKTLLKEAARNGHIVAAEILRHLGWN